MGIYLGNKQITSSSTGIYSDMSRQAIIDGNFQIAQVNPIVGNTASNPSANTYPVFDVWKIDYSTDGGTLPTTINHSQQNLTPGAVYNSSFCYRISPNGAGTNLGVNSYYRIYQFIENGTKYLCGDGKKVTLSFYAKSSISNKKIGIGLEQYYGTGGSPSGAEGLGKTEITLTSSWQKFTYTFTTNTLSGKTFGTNNDDYLKLYFWYIWGSNMGFTGSETFVGSGDIEITQVQICSGDTALPFQPKSFEDELKSCQRYYEKSYAYSISPGTVTESGDIFMAAIRLSDNYSVATVRFQVPKRIAAPTVLIWSPSSSTQGYIRRSVNGAAWSDNNTSLIHNSSTFLSNYGFVAGSSSTGGTTGDRIQYSLHFTADARF